LKHSGEARIPHNLGRIIQIGGKAFGAELVAVAVHGATRHRPEGTMIRAGGSLQIASGMARFVERIDIAVFTPQDGVFKDLSLNPAHGDDFALVSIVRIATHIIGIQRRGGTKQIATGQGAKILHHAILVAEGSHSGSGRHG